MTIAGAPRASRVGTGAASSGALNGISDGHWEGSFSASAEDLSSPSCQSPFPQLMKASAGLGMTLQPRT